VSSGQSVLERLLGWDGEEERTKVWIALTLLRSNLGAAVLGRIGRVRSQWKDSNEGWGMVKIGRNVMNAGNPLCRLPPLPGDANDDQTNPQASQSEGEASPRSAWPSHNRADEGDGSTNETAIRSPSHDRQGGPDFPPLQAIPRSCQQESKPGQQGNQKTCSCDQRARAIN
jgi:hypothetical protein